MHHILQEEQDKKGRFYLKKGEQIVAEMTYEWASEQHILIDHTSVNEVMKGMGVGQTLVMAAVTMARKLGIKILPKCSFAKKILEQNAELADVLYPTT